MGPAHDLETRVFARAHDQARAVGLSADDKGLVLGGLVPGHARKMLYAAGGGKNTAGNCHTSIGERNPWTGGNKRWKPPCSAWAKNGGGTSPAGRRAFSIRISGRASSWLGPCAIPASAPIFSASWKCFRPSKPRRKSPPIS